MFEQVVAEIYRAVLGRDVDAGALHNALNQIAVSGPEDGISTLIRELLMSGEYNARRNWARLPPRTPAPSERSFRHVISLGSDCYSSTLIKSHGLKRASTPFDWIFSSPGMVIHCILDDFKTFLDRSLIVEVPADDRRTLDVERSENVFYRDVYGVPKIFNHHDALEDDAYSYFVRCAARFRALLATEDQKLFVLVAHEHPSQGGELIDLVNTLRSVTRNATLLMVTLRHLSSHDGNSPISFEMRLDGDGRDFQHVSFRPTSAYSGTGFADPFDDALMHRLLSTYRFDVPPP